MTYIPLQDEDDKRELIEFIEIGTLFIETKISCISKIQISV